MIKKGLGKGLGALIPDNYVEMLDEKSAEGSTGFREIAVADIVPNRDQPRHEFNAQRLEELMQSIRSNGVIQPIVVSQRGRQYEIVCGERRFQAVKRLGLSTVPAIVRDVDPANLLEVALIENIQRQDLNSIEEAMAYQRLQESKQFSQEEIAQKVGKDRSTIANSIRLLRLPKDIQDLLQSDRISSGHARALLALPTEDYQKRLVKRIIAEGLSVRQTEEIVQRSGHKRRAKLARRLDVEIIDLERRLEQRLGTRVKLFAGKKKGRIEISYFSLDDLDRILTLLGLRAE